jgi:hypothetical protein
VGLFRVEHEQVAGTEHVRGPRYLGVARPPSVTAMKYSSCACGRKANCRTVAANSSRPPRSSDRHIRPSSVGFAVGTAALVTRAV